VRTSPDESREHLAQARTIANDQGDWALVSAVKDAEKEYIEESKEE